jgi:hypothetical protein
MKKLILSALFYWGMNTFAATTALIDPIASSVVINEIY